MADTFRLLLAQLNPTVGAIAANAAKARAVWNRPGPPTPTWPP